MDSVAEGLENLDLSDHADYNETNESLDIGALVAKEHVPSSTSNNSTNTPGPTPFRLGPSSCSWEVMGRLPAPFQQD